MGYIIGCGIRDGDPTNSTEIEDEQFIRLIME